jgi:hypothetical protein
MIMEFMGKIPIFNPLHIQDLMCDSNNINNAINFNIEEPIDLIDHGTMIEHVDCGYENPTRIENHWAFVNDLANVHTIIPFPHSQSFTKALNEVVANFNNILVDSLVPNLMKTKMKNVIKTPVQNATKIPR